MSGKSENSGAGFFLKLTVWIAVIGICLVFVMIAAFALPVLASGGGQHGVFSWQWLPARERFGILPMIIGSVLLALTALLLAWPCALGFSTWIVTARPGVIRTAARGGVAIMAAIPTVVYGFASIFLLTPLVRYGFGGGSGLCWLTASLVLALLVFPTMVMVMRAGLAPALASLGQGPAALGLTPAQTMAHIVLPTSKRVLAAAAMLGFGRAIGDTLVSLMLAGNAPQVPAGMGDSLRTLTAHMALVTANEVGGAAYDSLFAAGAIVLLLSGGVSFVVRRLSWFSVKEGL